MKACYVDSSVILSALVTTDARYLSSTEALKRLREQGWKLVTSTYAFAEAANNAYRRVVEGRWVLAEPLEKLVKRVKALGPRALCEALTRALLSLLEGWLRVEVVEDPELYTIESVNGMSMARLFREAARLAWINCRTKDLLHIAAASLMRKRGVKRILTADVENFERVKDALEKELDLEVHIVYPPRSAPNPHAGIGARAGSTRVVEEYGEWRLRSP